MRVNVEYIQHLKAELRKINEVPFEQLEFYENDVKLDIPQEVLDDWKFCGLNNADFITYGFHKMKSLDF